MTWIQANHGAVAALCGAGLAFQIGEDLATALGRVLGVGAVYLGGVAVGRKRQQRGSQVAEKTSGILDRDSRA